MGAELCLHLCQVLSRLLARFDGFDPLQNLRSLIRGHFEVLAKRGIDESPGVFPDRLFHPAGSPPPYSSLGPPCSSQAVPLPRQREGKVVGVSCLAVCKESN